MINRRDLLKRAAGFCVAGTTPIIHFPANGFAAKKTYTIADEIEKWLLTSCKSKNIDPYTIEGIYDDPSVIRCLRLGCYWYAERNGVEYAASIDFNLKYLQSRFGKDFSYVAFEQAINAIHNKYASYQRNEIHYYSFKMDHLKEGGNL